MKRGWGGSSFGGAVGEGCLERGLEKKEVAEEDLEVAWEEGVEREEEDEEGGPEEGACRRDMLGSCSVDGGCFCSCIPSASCSSSSSSTPSISPSSSSGSSPSSRTAASCPSALGLPSN